MIKFFKEWSWRVKNGWSFKHSFWRALQEINPKLALNLWQSLAKFN